MEQKRLNDCPNCNTPMEKDIRSQAFQQKCKSCNYTQHAHSEFHVTSLLKNLTQYCFDQGIDTFRLQGHNLTGEEALRGDSLLPLMIDACRRDIIKGEAIPFKAIEDSNALIGYRVVYSPEIGKNNASSYKVRLSLLLYQMALWTRKNEPDTATNVINLDYLMEILNGNNKDKPNPVKPEAITTKKYNVILSITDAREDKAKIGQLEQLRICGATLKSVPSLSAFTEKLDNEFPWFSHITNIIIRELTARSQGSNSFHIPPLLILGDPGIGKTAYCTRVAELAGVPSHTIGVAGSTSNQILAGTERGWNTAKPSLALQTILDHKVANPLIIIDEIDKAGGSEQNGHVLDTLLSLLEPASSRNWYDTFLMGHVDLSNVSWITTANSISHLTRTLLSRLRVVHAKKPEIEHYPRIVWETRKRFISDYSLNENWIPYFSDAEWSWLEKYYTSPRKTKHATEELLKEMLNSNPGKKLH